MPCGCQGEYLGGLRVTQEFIKIYMSCLLARGPLVGSFVQISGQGTFWYLGGLWGAFVGARRSTWGASGLPKSSYKYLCLATWPEDHFEKVLFRLVARVLSGTWGASGGCPVGARGSTWGASGLPKSSYKYLCLASWPEDYL